MACKFKSDNVTSLTSDKWNVLKVDLKIDIFSLCQTKSFIFIFCIFKIVDKERSHGTCFGSMHHNYLIVLLLADIKICKDFHSSQKFCLRNFVLFFMTKVLSDFWSTTALGRFDPQIFNMFSSGDGGDHVRSFSWYLARWSMVDFYGVFRNIVQLPSSFSQALLFLLPLVGI